MRVTRSELLEWADFLEVRDEALEAFGAKYLNDRVRQVIKELRMAAGPEVDPIIGQKAICPDGLGRVVSFKHWNGKVSEIKVDTYVNNRSCEWAAHNVVLLNPRGR